MKTPKEQIIKQARIYEDYQGNESAILGAEKSGKFHGFIAGAEWAIEKLEADKEELLVFIETYYRCLDLEYQKEAKSLIQKMKQ